MKIYTETERFILREVLEEDVHDFYELDSDPAVHRFLGNHPIKTLEEAEAVIRYVQKQYKDYGIGRWAIIDKNSNECLGWSGLKYETSVRPEFDYYDLGYRIKKKHWGRGVATETAAAALQYGFETLGLEHIQAGAHVDNIGSNRVLQKLGFTFKEVFVYEGLNINWYEYSLNDFNKKE